MTVRENKDLLSSFIKDVIDGKNLDAMEKYLSPNFFHHDLAPGEQTGQQTGAAGQRAFFSNVVFPAFGEFSTGFEDLIGEGDLVACRWRQSSRNSGPWLGRAPTGKRTEIAGISIVRIRDGMIVEEWEGRDGAGLLRQLGVPVPKGPLRRVQLDRATGAPAAPPPFLTNGPLDRSAVAADLLTSKAQAASVYMEAWNKGDLNALSRVLSDKYVLHDPTGLQSPNRDGSAALITAFRAGLPDLRVTVDLQLGEGDKVVNRWTVRGTHRGQLLGVAGSGRRVAVTGVSIQRFADGLVAEEWQLWEQLSFYEQVGALKV
jgi:steroid delta-isomerase-like uncharacterized protein